MKYKRIFLLICDSLGIGNGLDANNYDDEGANTLKHICDECNGLNIPNLEGLGLGNLGDFKGIYPLKSQLGYTLKLNELSSGKDTITGHFEMMGLYTPKNHLLHLPKQVFLMNLLNLFEAKTGRECIGNKAASGTNNSSKNMLIIKPKQVIGSSTLQPILFFKSLLMKRLSR